MNPQWNGAEPASGRQLPPAPAEPNLREVIRLLWRRKMLIASTIFLTMLVSVLIVFQLTPQYTAETQVLIGTRTSNVVDIESVLEALRPDRTTLQSEVEVLASRSLAEQVVDELGLMENPEFNQLLRPPSLRNPIQWLSTSLRSALFGGDSSALATPQEAERRARNDVVTALQEVIAVDLVRISRVASVTVTSEDPELAAKIANTLAEVYLREQIRQKLEAGDQAAVFLNERVETIRNQVEQSDKAVEDYRQQQGLTQARDTTLIEQQISEVNTLLIAAQARTAEADASLRQARAQMRSEGDIYAVPEVLAAPLIQNLRMQEARLAGEAAQMASEYGARHPQLINVTAELSDIRGKIAVEVDRIVLGLQNSLEVAQTRERALEQSLDDLKAEAAQLTDSQARLRILEREAEANRALFDVFLSRYNETGQQEDLQSADARVISRATVPSEPSWPNIEAAMGISLVVSILLSLLMVFLIEQVFDRGFRHTEQIENLLNTGTLGVVPMLDEPEETLPGYVLDKPVSAFAESLRMLHTGLLLTDAEDAPSVSVLVTSSVPEEGKTFIALAWARQVARSGRKVLLVDADLRHGQVGKRLGLSDKRGLLQLLTGHLESTEEAIQHDEHSGLDVLTAGRTVEVPTDILRSRLMSELMDKLKSSYELIIVDSPPSLLVSDSRTLARLLDKTVFVVRWADTVRKVAANAYKQLLESEAQMAGVVLSMAQVNRRGSYGYGYRYGYGYGYGYGYRKLPSKYERYYTR